MKTNIVSMAALFGLLILSACGKTGADPVSAKAETICFTEPLQTRAVVAADDRSVFEVRDWYDNKRFYINNTLRYSGGAWGYGSSGNSDDYPYEWNASRHLFFGWLDSDGRGGTSAGFFGTGYPSLSDTTLTIPAKTLDNTVSQYDFLYSDAVLRQSTETSPVQLTFKHLFAKVSISFRMSDECDASETITLNKVYLAGPADVSDPNSTTRVAFKNCRSATVTFSGKKGSEITYADGGTAGANGYFTKAPNSSNPEDFSITGFSKASTPIDVLSQTQSFSKIPYLVWPVQKGDLNGKEVIIVQYNGTTKHMSFPKGTVWEAGHMYDYVITFKGGTLKIEETILPWVGPEPEEIGGEKAEDHQPVMASWMGWDSQTCTVSGADRTVATFKNTSDAGDVDKDRITDELTPIRGRFRVYSPKECTWKIELTGPDASNFGLSYYYTNVASSSVPGSESITEYRYVGPENGAITGTISETPGTGETAPGDLIFFFISAPGGQGGADVTAGLKFSVTVGTGASARTYSLDSEIQKDGDFEIILPQAS